MLPAGAGRREEFARWWARRRSRRRPRGAPGAAVGPSAAGAELRGRRWVHPAGAGRPRRGPPMAWSVAVSAGATAPPPPPADVPRAPQLLRRCHRPPLLADGSAPRARGGREATRAVGARPGGGPRSADFLYQLWP